MSALFHRLFVRSFVRFCMHKIWVDFLSLVCFDWKKGEESFCFVFSSQHNAEVTSPFVPERVMWLFKGFFSDYCPTFWLDILARRLSFCLVLELKIAEKQNLISSSLVKIYMGILLSFVSSKWHFLVKTRLWFRSFLKVAACWCQMNENLVKHKERKWKKLELKERASEKDRFEEDLLRICDQLLPDFFRFFLFSKCFKHKSYPSNSIPVSRLLFLEILQCVLFIKIFRSFWSWNWAAFSL